MWLQSVPAIKKLYEEIVIFNMILLQRWTVRPVRGCEIFSQSFLKWQISRWGMASLPWQHHSGKIQNLASLLVQLCILMSM